MPEPTSLPSAETVERQFRLLALIMLCLALALATKALTKVVTDAQILVYLDYAKDGLAILTAIPTLIYIVWKVRFLQKVPRHLRAYLREPESFACEVWKKAVLNSWGATLVFLFFTIQLNKKFGGNIEFYSRLAIAVMLGVFSVSFFYLYRTEEEGENEEGVLD